MSILYNTLASYSSIDEKGMNIIKSPLREGAGEEALFMGG
jgi:hypothetical protein